MHRYRELLRFPNAWVLILAALPARISYGMISLAIFFKTEQATDSVAIAGLAIGINSVAGSLTSGIRGSIMDKWGQKWPLRIFVPCYAGMLLALNMAQDRNVLLVAAFILGITAPPINLSVRPLWKDVVTPDYLRVAYAVDSTMMNFAFVIGPVLATSLALSSHPGSALATASALMFIGGTSLALTSISRNWIPEKKVKGAVSLLRSKPLQLLMIEGCFIGFGWGLFDVAVPAFATLEGVPQRTAWIFGAMGFYQRSRWLTGWSCFKESLGAFNNAQNLFNLVLCIYSHCIYIPWLVHGDLWCRTRVSWWRYSSFLLGSYGSCASKGIANRSSGLALEC